VTSAVTSETDSSGLKSETNDYETDAPEEQTEGRGSNESSVRKENFESSRIVQTPFLICHFRDPSDAIKVKKSVLCVEAFI
jgi:hypothetical protein